MAAKQGFLMYYSKGDAIGTKVSVRYRRSGRLSGVVVKRGSTVYSSFLAAASLLLCSFKKKISVFKNKNKKPKWRFLASRGSHLNCAIMAMLYTHSIGNQP